MPPPQIFTYAKQLGELWSTVKNVLAANVYPPKIYTAHV